MNEPPKGAVFDFGGVISRAPGPDDAAGLLALTGLSWEALARSFATHRRAYDAGSVDCDTLYRSILADERPGAAPCWTPEELFQADSALWLDPMPGTLELMRELAGAGVKIGILTNMPAPFADAYFKSRFADAIAAASAVVVSAHEKRTKPDPEIYRIMERRIGLAPEDLLFFDDSPANVEAARSLGWRAEVFTSSGEARAAAHGTGLPVLV